MATAKTTRSQWNKEKWASLSIRRADYERLRAMASARDPRPSIAEMVKHLINEASR